MAAKAKANLQTRSELKSGPGRLTGCAINAAVNSFVIVLLGRIAFQIVSGVAGQMIPSAPPGFAGKAAADHAAHTVVWWDTLVSLRFKIFYGMVFLVCLWQQFTGALPPPNARGRMSRWRRIGWSFSGNWFGSLIGNAFLAMGLAYAAAAVPNFGLWKLFWHWFVEVTPIGAWLDDGPLTWLNPWLRWYDQNAVRFNFWLIYFAAVCDDFGIPNFKTLARWLWRRWKKPRGTETLG